MTEHMSITQFRDHVISEINERDAERVAERLNELGWEKVVRCRDCRHFNDYHNKCHRQQGVIVVLGDIVRIDEQKERLILTDAEPDGYCAWAVRAGA